MDHAAAIAGPGPDGQGELAADLAAVRADARAAFEAPVDMPRPPAQSAL